MRFGSLGCYIKSDYNNEENKYFHSKKIYLLFRDFHSGMDTAKQRYPQSHLLSGEIEAFYYNLTAWMCRYLTAMPTKPLTCWKKTLKLLGGTLKLLGGTLKYWVGSPPQ